jgi:hypothetical protein
MEMVLAITAAHARVVVDSMQNVIELLAHKRLAPVTRPKIIRNIFIARNGTHDIFSVPFTFPSPSLSARASSIRADYLSSCTFAVFLLIFSPCMQISNPN